MKEIKKRYGNSVVYTPKNAKLSFENNKMIPPKVRYEHRKVVFDKDKVVNVVKGIYGQREE